LGVTEELIDKSGMILKLETISSCFDLEGAALCEFALAACGLGQDVLAVVASDHSLGVAEDDRCFVAPPALHIHEVGIRSGDESFELVALSFGLEGGVE
jgi:hypothetical protein